MGFWKALFGKAKPEAASGNGLEEHLGYLNSLRLPAIALSGPADGRRSRIGGLPSLPEGEPWPEWKGKPLAFLCQLDLSEIPPDCDRQGLPSSGVLFFFSDQDQEAWGFDPKHLGGWRVIYAETPSSVDSPRAAPAGLDEECVYKPRTVSLTRIETYPNHEDARVGALGMNKRQKDEYDRLREGVFGGRPQHHLFGYPSPIQSGDMDLECQLAANGLFCGNESGYKDPRRAALEAGRTDWVLLLQLDTDDDAGMMWGDAGMLYFWIRKQDLQEGRFDRCWMILQCF